MKLRKVGHYLAGLLAAVLVLGLSTTVLALEPAYEIWSGPFSFTLTMTDRDQTTKKLVKKTQTATGTVNMYIIADGDPTPGPNGYCLEFIDSQNGLTVGIKGLEIVNSKIASSKSMKIMGVGTGDFLQGAPPVPVGPAYISLKGTVALNAPVVDNGIPTLITATLTMGGGSPSEGPNGGQYIWSGKPKIVLHK